MIRNLTAGYGLQISGNTGYSAPYIDATRPSAGMVRYLNNNLEIYDGSNWMTMQSSYPQVEFSGEVQSILAWARGKMAEEARVKELADKHPTVADALEAVKQADEQVKIVAALVDTA
jgi:hypothetical protein